ncbi:uncharacterized protein LOC126394167 [Epinephelus moara]|uniref:uncharacterized protein LOC126394167 n=1 Tax=Epinephelus moara TaxID=300413 RepID=UPI00214EC85F|nr:uncharacterized protein LOC126394167 [Epinephelus moara]
MPIIIAVVSEAYSYHQLLSHNSHEAESQDQRGDKHGDSGSTRNTEPNPERRRHVIPPHEERDHSEDQTLNFSPDDTPSAANEESVGDMPVISSVVSEEHSYQQLLSHNSPEAESQDQRGDKHGDSGSTGHTEPNPKKIRHMTPTHEERDHSEDQTLNFNPDDTPSAADKESVVNTPVISSVVLEEHSYHHLLSHNSPEAESQDQRGDKHGDSGSTRNAEPKRKRRRHKSRSHSNYVNNPLLPEIHWSSHTEFLLLHVCKEEEVLSEQQLCIQERNSSVDQEEPEPPQIKEEEEELCSSQEGEQLVLKQETDASMLTPTHEERDHSEDQTLNFSPDDTFTAEKEFEVSTPVISSVILEEHNYHQLLSHNFHELPEIHRNTQTVTMPAGGTAAEPLPGAPSEHTVPSTCEQGRDGTPWRSIQPGGHSGRQQSQNVLTETTGPTAHAKRNIEDALSAFTCLLDRNMLRHIQDCTVAEAHRMEEDSSWDLSIAELKAFIALLYVRGAYNRNIEMESFWSEEWGLAFFAATMPRNRFRDIMRYLRFDMKYRQTCPPEQRQICSHVRCVGCLY